MVSGQNNKQILIFFAVAALIAVGIIVSKMTIKTGGGQPEADIPVPHVDSSNFEREVLQANVLVLVDFYADWCQPCNLMSPTIASLYEEYESGTTVKVFKLDVEKSSEIAAEYGIQNIPTIIFFKDGKEVQRCVGLVGYDSIKAIITGEPVFLGG